MATMPAVSQQRESAADVLEEAWSSLVDAYRLAERELPFEDRARFDGYLAQVFDPDSRMLGMQSISQWIDELARALRGQPDPEEEA